ncbi:MAG: phosphoribosyltransferase, partial [Actinobacteria bacterium]|nr:phosphoribosyltransferase [Actinomycetota bacterium]
MGTRIEPFDDRADAGRALGERLFGLHLTDPVVLGLARGGVAVAAAAAEVLHVPFDVVVTRKVGAPGNPEFGLGAVAPGVVHLGPRAHQIASQGYLDAEIHEQMGEVERRTLLYRGKTPELDLSGRTAVIVDDGVATGGTAIAALEYARDRGAA